jgi:hypothetical protein
MSDSKTGGGGAILSSSWSPKTDAEREAVREQIGGILASSLFRNSKRLSSLLQHTTELVLKANGEPPKERTLGIEVFGREPTYDTAQDPVVRITAVEIRKRLSQYYQAAEHEKEIRVDFPPGSYLPGFHLPTQTSVPTEGPVPQKPAATAGYRRWLVTAVIGGCILIFALVWWRSRARETYLDRFWQPVLKSSSSVLLCLGDDRTVGESNTAPPSADPAITNRTTVAELLRRDTVRFSNALTLSMLTGFLRARDKSYRVRRTGGTALQDLRDGPVVLIGLMDNAWTLRLGSQLRFGFENEGGRYFIKDRQNPSNRRWGYDGLNTPLANVPEAHGIISRVFDRTTGHVVVTVAGLFWGTRAAGECLIDSGCLKEAARLAPGDWSHKNIQIVISAVVIGENSGPPHVISAHLW